MNPFVFMVLCTAGWMNRNQQGVIEYLQEEVRVLKELLVSVTRSFQLPTSLAEIRHLLVNMRAKGMVCSETWDAN